MAYSLHKVAIASYNVDFMIDLDIATKSQDYCDELKGKVASYGLEISELSTHIQGQLVATHPAHDTMFDVFAPDKVKGNEPARREWAIDQVKKFHFPKENIK